MFFPMAIGIYFLLPRSQNLLLRNLFLIFISLVFYAWGEPLGVFLLIALIVLTWLLGKMADGSQNAGIGKIAVFLTVAMNVGVLLTFSHFKRILYVFGISAETDGSFFRTSLPIGLSFFAFHSISYVVDIYRGQCKGSQKLYHTALYLSAFFKMLQGPIVAYRDFEPQIENRSSSATDFSEGIWRLAVGLCKKMVIAENLAWVAKGVFASDFSILSLCDAWIGCAVFMIVLYYDFSGYSDMAIGLARIFGFKMPENFNYPYVSTSIGEYWRRWHITLCAWFRDYLYFPIVLGPSVSFRKFLLRHHVNDQIAETMQNIFVPSCVWLVTALWHGNNWNYTIWGVINSSAMIVEPHFSPIKNNRIKLFIRWFGTMLILIFCVPLIATDSFVRALLYWKAMFAGNGICGLSGLMHFCLSTYRITLLVSVAGSLMFFAWIKKRFYPVKNLRLQMLWQWGEAVFLMSMTIIALGILFKTGAITFMYQQ